MAKKFNETEVITEIKEKINKFTQEKIQRLTKAEQKQLRQRCNILRNRLYKANTTTIGISSRDRQNITNLTEEKKVLIKGLEIITEKIDKYSIERIQYIQEKQKVAS